MISNFEIMKYNNFHRNSAQNITGIYGKINQPKYKEGNKQNLLPQICYLNSGLPVLQF